MLNKTSTKDMVSRDPKSGHKFKFSGGLIWIVLHYPKREQSLFIYLFLEMVHNKNKHSKTPASKLKLMSWLRISGNHIFSDGLSWALLTGSDFEFINFGRFGWVHISILVGFHVQFFKIWVWVCWPISC